MSILCAKHVYEEFFQTFAVPFGQNFQLFVLQLQQYGWETQAECVDTLHLF